MPNDARRILLLEAIHDVAAATFSDGGYDEIISIPRALSEDELLGKLPGVHLLGIRSRTRLNERALAAADRLLAIGCFCIGTSQVDIPVASRIGIPVFNAPFSSTRSVAELVMAEIIMLMRGIFPKSQSLHRGRWQKSASYSFEVRGRTLGVVGYGNIGAQLGLIAESGFGMRVIYYDVADKLSFGNAQCARSLEELLASSDIVSLHVPETPATIGMIGGAQIRAMQKGAFLVNASRGSVVDPEALAAALRDGHLLGTAIDVFPVEPERPDDVFLSPLMGIPNVILTPHIGGSTAEAQERIGIEVAKRLIAFDKAGQATGAVNAPELCSDAPTPTLGYRQRSYGIGGTPKRVRIP
jgi:D-3-phosphoglycerate dehydrogenase / 2-oxoglutarate reductase